MQASDVDWEHLDKPRYYFWGFFFSLGVRAFVYPPGVVKTRLQTQAASGAFRQYGSTYDAIRKMWMREGVKGFYKGFPSFVVGTIPAQMIYVSTLEYVRSHLRRFGGRWFEGDSIQAGAVRNFIGGGMASIASSAVTVPADVISQKLMIQDGLVNKAVYSGGTNALKSILKESGVKGLYRGWGATLCVYVPNSMIWWSSYLVAKRAFQGELDRVGIVTKEPVLNAASGATAGMIASTLTNPLDVAKTRIQVLQKGSPGTESIFHMMQYLWRQEGMAAFTRGLVARMLSQVPVSVLLIVTYEQVKALSTKSM